MIKWGLIVCAVTVGLLMLLPDHWPQAKFFVGGLGFGLSFVFFIIKKMPWEEEE